MTSGPQNASCGRDRRLPGREGCTTRITGPPLHPGRVAKRCPEDPWGGRKPYRQSTPTPPMPTLAPAGPCRARQASRPVPVTPPVRERPEHPDRDGQRRGPRCATATQIGRDCARSPAAVDDTALRVLHPCAYLCTNWNTDSRRCHVEIREVGGIPAANLNARNPSLEGGVGQRCEPLAVDAGGDGGA